MGQENSIIQHLQDGSDENKLERVILEHPECIKTTDSYGWTPLHWAVFFQKYNIARLLIRKGADSMFVRSFVRITMID